MKREPFRKLINNLRSHLDNAEALLDDERSLSTVGRANVEFTAVAMMSLAMLMPKALSTFILVAPDQFTQDQIKLVQAAVAARHTANPELMKEISKNFYADEST